MRLLAVRFCVVLVLTTALGANCMDDMSAPQDDPSGNIDPPMGGDPNDPPVVVPPLVCEPACGFGLVCRQGACVPVDTPEAQIGFTDDATNIYSALSDGATMPLYTFGQGGGHMFVTIRVAGIAAPSDGTLDVRYEVVRPADGAVLSMFSQMTHFTSLGNGILEARRRVIFLSDFPELLHEDTIRCTIVVTSAIGTGQTVTIDQTLVLDFRP